MSEPGRPPLDPFTSEEIDQLLHAVDKTHWPLITAFRVKKRYPPDKPVPPPAPKHLLNNIQWYASKLFATEADQFDQFRKDARYPAWLSRLADRVMGRVLTTLDRLQESATDSLLLDYHGLTKNQITQDLRTMLWEFGRQYEQGTAPSQVKKPAEIPVPTEQAKPEVTEVESLAIQLKRLRDEAGITADKLAEALDVDPRSIYKHLAGKTIPRQKHIRAYEKLFSEVLQRPVTLKGH